MNGKVGVAGSVHMFAAGASISQQTGAGTSGRVFTYTLLCASIGPGLFIGGGITGTVGLGGMPADNASDGDALNSMPDEIGMSGDLGAGPSGGVSIHIDSSGGGEVTVPISVRGKGGFGYGARAGADFCWVVGQLCGEAKELCPKGE